MPSFLRTLESWTTHQDYLWFLAGLAWTAVAAAVWRRSAGAPRGSRWVLGWAFANILSALLELALLAGHYEPSAYPVWERLLWGAQVVALAFLVWGALEPMLPAVRARLFVLAGTLAATAALRELLPVAGGFALALAHVLAVRALLRSSTSAFASLAGSARASLGVLLFWPLLAPHGPLAHAIGRGREDYSRFALVGAATLFAAGLLLALGAWRKRLADFDDIAGSSSRRDVRRQLWLLVVWLLAGFGLMIWSGQLARRDFEHGLLARARTAQQALDPLTTVRALKAVRQGGRIEPIRTARGVPAERIEATALNRDDLSLLWGQLGRIHDANPELRYVYLSTLHEQRIVNVMVARKQNPRSRFLLVNRHADATDFDLVARAIAAVTGPRKTPWGSLVGAQTPILDPETKQVLGWLVLEVASSRWLAAFSQTRLQTLALVGLGAALWAVSLAYTFRKTAAEAVAHRARAATEADRLKSEFLAMVSHELRTPIQSVLGYGELIASESLGADGQRWVAALRSHGQIMLRLVNDLIDIGAIQSGAFRLQTVTIDLQRVVEEAVSTVRAQALAKRLALQAELAPLLPSAVVCDPVRLRQILVNLLANAIKFTPAGEVRLLVRHASDTPSAGSRRFAFVVSDTGPGIPPERRAELFQPFRRGDAAAEVEGTGLGLALVAGLCRSMGGDVRLDESASPGATFVVTLPLAEAVPAPAGSPAALAERSAAWSGVRILVAEDNALVRQLLVDFLCKQGADVVAVPDGESALGRASTENFHVILLDWMIPGRDGLAVARALRARATHPDRPYIIGLSAHAGADAFPRAHEAGMNAFLPKPVQLAALAHMIQLAPDVPPAPVLAAGDGFPLTPDLQAQFARELPGLVAEIEAAAASGDFNRLRARTHYLKNSADIVHATRLSAACQIVLDSTTAADPAAQQAHATRIATASRHPFHIEVLSPTRYEQTSS